MLAPETSVSRFKQSPSVSNVEEDDEATTREEETEEEEEETDEDEAEEDDVARKGARGKRHEANGSDEEADNRSRRRLEGVQLRRNTARLEPRSPKLRHSRLNQPGCFDLPAVRRRQDSVSPVRREAPRRDSREPYYAGRRSDCLQERSRDRDSRTPMRNIYRSPMRKGRMFRDDSRAPIRNRRQDDSREPCDRFDGRYGRQRYARDY